MADRRIREGGAEEVRRQEALVDEERILDENLQVVRKGSAQVPVELRDYL